MMKMAGIRRNGCRFVTVVTLCSIVGIRVSFFRLVFGEIRVPKAGGRRDKFFLRRIALMYGL